MTAILAELAALAAAQPSRSTPDEVQHLLEHGLVFDDSIDTVEFRPAGFVSDAADQIAINPAFVRRTDPAIVADQLIAAVFLVRAFR